MTEAEVIALCASFLKLTVQVIAQLVGKEKAAQVISQAAIDEATIAAEAIETARGLK